MVSGECGTGGHTDRVVFALTGHPNPGGVLFEHRAIRLATVPVARVRCLWP
jgi:hypothetical protein